MEPENTGIDLSCYDLHSHTTASDGMLTPEQLLDRAVEMKVTVLAITDHDTTDALPAAHHYQQANNLPLTVINGVEISTLWEHHEIHIVGLNIDITHPAMTELLAQQSERRRHAGCSSVNGWQRPELKAPGKRRMRWRRAVKSRADTSPGVDRPWCGTDDSESVQTLSRP